MTRPTDHLALTISLRRASLRPASLRPASGKKKRVAAEGFTFTELLVVSAVMIVLLGTAMFFVGQNYQESRQYARVGHLMSGIRSARALPAGGEPFKFDPTVSFDAKNSQTYREVAADRMIAQALGVAPHNTNIPAQSDPTRIPPIMRGFRVAWTTQPRVGNSMVKDRNGSDVALAGCLEGFMQVFISQPTLPADHDLRDMAIERLESSIRIADPTVITAISEGDLFLCLP